MTVPRTAVAAPAVIPARFGLLSVAAQPVGVDEHIRNGIEWETTPACATAKSLAEFCGTVQFDAPSHGVPWATADPFSIYTDYSCQALGRDVTQAQARAVAALDFSAPRELERVFWTGKDTAANSIAPSLLGAYTLSGSTQGVLTGIGLLEKWLGQNYAGQGIIHAPRSIAPMISHLLTAVGGHLETILGTRVAFGLGYTGSGPDGTAATTGTEWMYATGSMSVRSFDTFLPDAEQAFDRVKNQLSITASRTYLLSVDCPTSAAVEVELQNNTGGGGDMVTLTDNGNGSGTVTVT